jgi:hypothetical protein
MLGPAALMAFVDALTHEADLRGALRADRLPAGEVPLAMKPLVARWRQTLAGAGVPPLLVRVVGGRDWTVGAASAEVHVDVDLYDLFRALTGRRSAAQVARWAWSRDPGPFIRAGLPFPFTWAADDLDD